MKNTCHVFFSVTCHSVTQAHVSLLKTFGKNSVSNINFDDMLAIFLKWPRAKVLVKMCSYIVHKTFLELLCTLVLQRSRKQVKQMGTCLGS